METKGNTMLVEELPSDPQQQGIWISPGMEEPGNPCPGVETEKGFLGAISECFHPSLIAAMLSRVVVDILQENMWVWKCPSRAPGMHWSAPSVWEVLLSLKALMV